ncbi:MAG TPA: DNA mismatch endonuclease Vsr [Saprospiraceae bacterium]|nr:DNA mismatch endonuclease Vsr [Saprospiraceae bacterium]
MDVLTKEQRKKNMQAIKSKNTKIEIILAKALWSRGFRYTKNNSKIFGKPDLVFSKYKIAVFCDSEFFHGKDWETAKNKIKSNQEFWLKKIKTNIIRDHEVNKRLEEEGWVVLRFWGEEIKKNTDSCVSKITKVIMERQAVRYSDIRSKLRIGEPKTKYNTELANFTHYLQNKDNGSGRHFENFATEFIEQAQMVAEDLNIQYELPIDWDVPFPPPKPPKFQFIDLFAGIGGFRLAFQRLGGKCVFTSEWNPFSQKTYEANFGEVPFGDITKINETHIPDHDILLAGFPCQPFSIAGVSKKKSLGLEHGFKDEAQGTLFFDIVRILEAKKPKAFMLENVKNLVSHDKGNTFRVIKGALSELGYSIYYQVLDGKYYVPQHRERIIIVGFNSQIFNSQEQFKFPDNPDKVQMIKNILEYDVPVKYTLTDKLWKYLQDYAAKHKEKGNGFGFGLIDFESVTRTISARYYKDGSEILIPQAGKNPRRLTPRECARLQGYPDNFIIPVSDTQAYRQFGNSVVVPLIQAVGDNIVDVLINSHALSVEKNISDKYKGAFSAGDAQSFDEHTLSMREEWSNICDR